MKFLCSATIFLLAFAAITQAQERRLKIIEQPRPELPQKHATLDVQGNTILRVQFLEFGEVGEVVPVKELPSGLTQLAVTAARKIRFEPELKDGKPVTVYRQVEYFYSWNGGWRVIDNSAPEAPAKAEGNPAKAAAIIERAIQILGGSRYLQITSQVGKGKFSSIRDGMVSSFQSFLDVIAFPDRERTEFKGGGSRHIQVNTGDAGWVFDGDTEVIKLQDKDQVANFKMGIRTSLDNLLRGYWKNDAVLDYAGRRPASLGKRNDVVRLTYKDGFVVEFEFADDGTPQKSVYSRINAEGEDVKEEDRYAQFIDIGGIKAPFIIDRFTNGKASSRINFESIEYNKTISDAIFAKPANAKEAKKEIKF